MRLLRALVVMLVLAVAGLAGYAYLGDMAPEPAEVRVPVTLGEGTLVQPTPAAGATPAATPTPAADTAPTATPAGGDVLD